MKTRTLLLLLVVALVFGSCSTAYKSGQTPDDVYNSPAPSEEEYAKAKKSDERRYRQYDGEEDEYAYEDYDDRYLRMKVRNRSRWNDLDDWYYYGNRYNFSYYNNWYYWNDPWYWNNPWSPVSYWNMYYNPYYSMYGGWYGGYYGGMYGGWGGWYGSYWNPWYSPWYYGGYGYGGYGYGYGWGGYWDPYLYGPGAFVGGTRSAYGPRTTNLRTYDRGVVDRGGVLLNNGNTGYRSTYGVRSEGSVNTNETNSSASTRGSGLRERYGSSNNTYNRSVESYSRPASIDTRSSSYPSSSGSSSSSFGGSSSNNSSSGGGGGSAPSRRF